MDDEAFKKVVLERFAHLETRLDRVDTRMDAIHARLDDQDSQMDDLTRAVMELRRNVAYVAETGEHALEHYRTLSRRVTRLEHPDDK